MIRMEYPKVNLDSYTEPEEMVKALKRQVDVLTDNLQIVLDSIEEDTQSIVKSRIDSIKIPNKVTVDSSFSATSENPVQNKIIKSALDAVDSAIDDVTDELDGKVGATVSGSSTTVSLANATSFADTGVSFSLAPGVYVITAAMSFSSGTGRRGLRLYYGGDTSWADAAVSANAVSGANTRLEVTRIIKVNTGVSEMKVQAFQNSGGALSCDVLYRYLKLA